MSNLTARSDNIRDRLIDHWGQSEVIAPGALPLRTWVELGDRLGPVARFGLGTPRLVEIKGQNLISVPFCAEIIDRVTIELSDEDLDAYLDGVEFLADLALTEVCRGADEGAAWASAEEQCTDRFPGTMRLHSMTQMAALDRGVA